MKDTILELLQTVSSDMNGNIKLLAFPKVIWNGTVASIPAGWSLCDGGTYNGYNTPDLRGRFVVGASTTAGPGLTLRNVGDKTGGEEAHTLIPDEIPAHSHNLNSAWKALSPDAYGKGLDSGNHNSVNVWDFTPLSNINSSSVGGSKPHNNMPPFYALCYICYTG